MLKSLVTGGAGFIGSNLALRLQSLGHEVTILDDFSSAAESNLKDFRGKVIRTDVAHPWKVEGDFHFIFHQAAITDPRHGNDKDVYEKNVAGFKNALQFSLAKKARLVYASTAGLYGNGPVPMQEDQPKDLLTVYGKSKLENDVLSEQHFSQLGIVGLRYFNVFGPRETHKGRPASMVLHLMRQMKHGKPPRIFKNGEHLRDFVYVEDVVEANLCALQSASGIFNVGTGVATTFNALVDALNKCLGTSLAPEYIEMPFDSATYQHHTVADTKKAEKMLGFKASWGLPRALENYHAWLEKEGQLASL